MISYYFYKIQVNELGQHGKAPSEDSLHPILDFYTERPLICNMQTRMIAGVYWASLRSPISWLGYWFPSLMLRVAWRNLTTKFHWIFFQDTADRDFSEFASHYGLDYQAKRFERTVTKARPSCRDLSSHEREGLLRLNSADVALYEKACEWRGESAMLRKL